MVSVGTRGDVQPFVAVAQRLTARGHDVVVASHREHEPFVRRHGCVFRDAGASMRSVLESELGRAWIESADSLTRYARTMRAVGDAMWPAQLAAAEAMTEDVDAIVAHPFALHAFHQAEARRLPTVSAALVPFVPSRGVAPLFFPRLPAWGWLRLLLGNLTTRSVYATVAHHHEPYRATLGLPSARPDPFPKLRAAGVPVLHLYSPSLVPRPADWPADVGVTGFAFLPDDASFVPPAGLERFLADGEPPIYVGFGSMTGKAPVELTATVVDAVRRARVRAVIGRGWGGTDPVEGDDVFVVEDVPHGWLFPRVRAVVHHGGVGTLAAGLRAGRPGVVAAFFGDQPFWGHALAARGAGPRPLLRRQIDAASLAASIGEVLGERRYSERARAVAAELAAEDGAGAAAAFLERHLTRPRPELWRRT